VGPHVVAALEARGWDVVTAARAAGDVRVDLTDRATTAAALGGLDLDAAINCAALTDVDACEREPQRAELANCRLVANLVAALPATCHLVHVSTDQVYPGTAAPHREDAAAPVNAYGRTKLAGEGAARVHPVATVLRTNVVGPSLVAGRAGLSDWILTSLHAGLDVDGFTDVTFSPLHLVTLSAWVATIVGDRLTGTYNLGSRDGMSKYDFAVAIAANHGYPPERIHPVVSESMPGRAPRPADMRLDVAAFESAASTRLPTLTEEVVRI
jgi:dTDP-4-dehydrorhamnose reductase